jgi:hypothetical protein
LAGANFPHFQVWHFNRAAHVRFGSRLCKNGFPYPKLHATGDYPHRNDGLSIFLLGRVQSQPGRKLKPCLPSSTQSSRHSGNSVVCWRSAPLNETPHRFPRRFSKRIIASMGFSHSLGQTLPKCHVRHRSRTSSAHAGLRICAKTGNAGRNSMTSSVRTNNGSLGQNLSATRAP